MLENIRCNKDLLECRTVAVMKMNCELLMTNECVTVRVDFCTLYKNTDHLILN